MLKVALNIAVGRRDSQRNSGIVPSLPGFAVSKPIAGVIGPRLVAELVHSPRVRLFGQSCHIVQGIHRQGVMSGGCLSM